MFTPPAEVLVTELVGAAGVEGGRSAGRVGQADLEVGGRPTLRQRGQRSGDVGGERRDGGAPPGLTNGSAEIASTATTISPADRRGL